MFSCRKKVQLGVRISMVGCASRGVAHSRFEAGGLVIEDLTNTHPYIKFQLPIADSPYQRQYIHQNLKHHSVNPSTMFAN